MSSAGRRRDRNVAPYERLVDEIAEQLRSQSTGPARSVVAVMPVVGFGAQSAGVLAQSLDLLGGALGADDVLVVLVNRPGRQVPDDTAALVESWRRRHRGAPVLVADVALALRPRIGELRQAGIEAVGRAWGGLPPTAALLFVDDDLVAVPAGTVGRLRNGLTGAPLAVGPVLFDHPDLPTCLFPDLYTGDLFRALLTDLVLDRLERDPMSVSVRTIESLVLSGNLALRADALERVGGLHDLNELTEVTRDILAASSTTGSPPLARSLRLFSADTEDDPVERLLRLAVRVHSRRALAAYAASGVPTVAQWRSQRLRSSIIDPVRIEAPRLAVPRPLAQLPISERAELLTHVERHLTVVLNHLRPELSAVRLALSALGLAARDVGLQPPTTDEAWQVRLHRTTGLVDRLLDLQGLELGARAEISSAVGVGGLL